MKALAIGALLGAWACGIAAIWTASTSTSDRLGGTAFMFFVLALGGFIAWLEDNA